MVSSPDRRPRSLIFQLIAIVAVSLLAGGYLAVSLASANLANWGLWLRDFAQSPGLVAVAALSAALIAFSGISKQVSVSQAVLAHQRATARSDSWWAMFEWASDRAIPKGIDDRPLPSDVAIRTLMQLADEATTSVQEAACSGVIDALTREMADAVLQEPAEEVDNDPIRSMSTGLEALAAYVKANVGTAAASPVAEALLYERQLLRALGSLPASDVRVFRNPPSAHDGGFDAIAEVRGKRVAILIKRPSRPAHAHASISRTIERFRAADLSDAVLVITPFPSPLSEDRQVALRTVVAQWRDERDTASLLHALQRASEL